MENTAQTTKELNTAIAWAISDEAYWAGWDWVVDVAPSKNAVYDKIQAMVWTSEVDDTAYWVSWNWVTTIAPSKNAVYDKIATIDTNITNLQTATSSLLDPFLLMWA